MLTVPRRIVEESRARADARDSAQLISMWLDSQVSPSRPAMDVQDNCTCDLPDGSLAPLNRLGLSYQALWSVPEYRQTRAGLLGPQAISI